jgi:hypothetical protein
MTKGARVQLADVVVPLAALRADPTRYARLFEKARTLTGYAVCLCTEPHQRLVIRQRSGRFRLACWPGHGEQHAPRCDFHSAGALSGRSGYTHGAITEDEDGVRIKLDSQLALRTAPAALQTPKSKGKHRNGAARRSMTLLGLLHYLWEQARLNTWNPADPRSWTECHDRLRIAIADAVLNGRHLERTLYVVPPFRPDVADLINIRLNLFTSQLGTRGHTIHRGLILGELKEPAETQYGWRLQLRNQRLPLYLTAEHLQKLRRAHRAAFSENRPDRSRSVGLFLIDRTAKGNLTVVDGAVMLTNRDYVPADSSHEVVMADHLAAAGRPFIKPLRYDHLDAVFPDFLLLDTTPAPSSRCGA